MRYVQYQRITNTFSIYFRRFKINIAILFVLRERSEDKLRSVILL